MAKRWTHDELLQMLKGHLAETSQTKLAAQIGVSESFLSRVINGKDRISNKMAEWLVNCRVKTERITVFRRIA